MRSAFFERVRRSLSIAIAAEREGIPTREAIERAQAAKPGRPTTP